MHDKVFSTLVYLHVLRSRHATYSFRSFPHEHTAERNR